MTPQPPSGTQIRLIRGDQCATIVTVGGAVREYSVADRDVFAPYPEDRIAPLFNGAVLLPWPNRLEDGRYEFDGREFQVPVSEPERGTALHGLAAWQRWEVVHAEESAVELELHLPPSPGYPFDLVARVTYRLTQTGLDVVLAATNVGAGPAPYGAGFHPWLSTGGASVNDCSLRLDANSHVSVNDRLLPTGTEPVAGTFDLREGPSLAGRDLDDAFVDVLRDSGGLSWARLAAPDGKVAAVWMDDSLDTWQVCTGDHVQPESWQRRAVAAEPMSCVANALRTGDRLVRIEPGETHTVHWGACLLSETTPR